MKGWISATEATVISNNATIVESISHRFLDTVVKQGWGVGAGGGGKAYLTKCLHLCISFCNNTAPSKQKYQVKSGCY